jgi:hypothetical protein
MGLIVMFGCGMDMNGDSLFDREPDDMDYTKGCQQLIIDESKYNAASTDDFTISKAFITGDSLMVNVQFGGGCGTTDFSLLTDGLFMESNPVQLNLFLSFTDQDPCEAAIQKVICFDLSNLATLYNDSYQTSGGTIIIHLNNYDNILGYDF